MDRRFDLRIPEVLAGPTTRPDGVWMRYALRRSTLKERGNLFLAVSDALRRRAIAEGFPEDRTLTHYNGVDLDLFRPEERPPVPGCILFVGRLVEKKGVAELLDAFAAVKIAIQEARLCIIGDGPLAQIVFSDRPVNNYRSTARGDKVKARKMMLGLFASGVFINPMGTKLYLSIAHDEKICCDFCDRLDCVLEAMG